ncbi:(2Fe-2S)-binding protein [Streptomyces sp. NA04227]|uniref:(2Fe-2S)-binding protein n=1 Tax=Streptomyces sp. NA04227 TaxID=2742136 RepID=UPI00159031AB|nr:(2Fe-2S)-binding protein [Streptomyces sp. NA04227]QKW10315.1 (2Fe-2S)-binding protein [Streptomyces sp. NA04227]
MAQDFDATQLADIGGFFRIRTGRAPATARPLGDVYAADADADDDPLTARVRMVAQRIRAPEPRVAVALVHLGLAARLWSLALGSAALYETLPGLDPDRLYWDPLATTGEDLWLDEVRPVPADTAAVDRTVRAAHLDPFAEVLRTRYAMAQGLLDGNSGSALAAAVREIDRWALRRGRPEVAARAAAYGDALFADPVLVATGSRTAAGFRRRSCCLYYRVEGGGVCGDCCFTVPPGGRGGVRGAGRN